MRALALVAVVGCSHGDPERVAPPPPTGDCDRVAEFFASYDLGNYAEPEERAPVVAKYKAECERASVTKEQSTCVEGERDKWSAAQCVPKMVPELAAKDPACKDMVTELKGQKRDEADAYTKHEIDRTIRALWQSCELDHWSGALEVCAGKLPDPRNIYTCQTEAGPLLEKIQERINQSLAIRW